MYKIYIILYVTVSVGVRCSPFLESDNVLKPQFERNKVNKGVWLRNNSPDPAAQSSLGFIFRANSLDVESQVQNGFESFSSKQEGLTSEFVGRYKREPHSAFNSRLRKSALNNRIKQINSTPSYINDYYPYEVTVIRNNPNNKNIDYNVYPKSSTKAVFEEHNDTEVVTEIKTEVTKEINKKEKSKDLTFEYLRDLVNITSGNVSNVPKRSMKYESENERINLLEAVNTNSNAITNNNEKDEKRWQIAPVTDVVYEIVPKETNIYNYKESNDVKRGKAVSERGLIKVLSMLTKTFKKIMKQHNDIKSIHSQMHTLNEGCKMNIEKHAKRLEEFDSKYAFFLKIIEKIKTLQDQLKSREEGYKRKEEEMSKYLLKLEGQQKTFLLQQQQFFNIQKSMLAQNEKINQKQNAIAKAQNDISLRQSNYARVLEKAKKMYIASKHPQSTTSVETKTVFDNVTEENKINDIQSTTTESIKINLFSIPAANPILNHDEMILRELYDKPVDDLIYKYYFNNTFIDTIIKNKILPGFIISDKTAIARNAKHKRNKHTNSNTDDAKNASRSLTARNSTKLDTTVLLPVYNDSNTNSTHRERRWINHHSKKRHRKHHGKGHSVPMHHSLFLSNDINNTKKTKTTAEPLAVKTNTITNDPFMKMATHFCNEIGQNSTKQILDWCVEKALRRLRSLDTKLAASPSASTNVVKETTQLSVTESSYMPPQKETLNMKLLVTKAPVASKPTTPVSTPTKEVPKPVTVSELIAFFPDNDELETNLKQFDLTRDPVGNVYYDGSLHESDIVGDKSDAPSDLVPGFDSNSKMDLDTRMIMEMPYIKRFHNQRLQNLKKTQRMGRRL